MANQNGSARFDNLWKALAGEAGVIHTLSLLIIVAAVGVISFLLISSTVPLNGLFGVTNPKPDSHAATTGCQYLSSPGATSAFCDDLSGGAKAGGRAGDLDESKWSASRIVGDDNNNVNLFNFPQTPVSSCKNGVSNVNADNDLLVCDQASGHQGQFLAALNAQYYGLLSLRPRQPFDFAGRTGTISYNVDAINEGGLSWWTSLFVTDEPFSGANNSTQVNGMIAKNGVGVNFDDNCGTQATQVRVNNVFVYNNFTETQVPLTNTVCVQTSRGLQNHIEIRLSQTNIQIWASDFSPDGTSYPNFRMIGSANISLPFSRGYVHFQTAERAPLKYTDQFNIHPTYANYYWSNLGFDGPVLPMDTGYQVADALTNNPTSGLNVGYALLHDPYSTYSCCNNGSQTTIGAFSLPNVTLQGVTSAKLTFTIAPTYSAPFTPTTIAPHYRFNGGAWKDPNPAPDYTKINACSSCPGPTGGPQTPFSFPVALSDLATGTNTLEFSIDGTLNSYPPILANVDLLTFGGAAPSSTPNPSASPTPSGSGKVGDLDNDGDVDIFDYSALVSNFGRTGTNILGDIDHDGDVDIFDYSALVSNFGK